MSQLDLACEAEVSTRHLSFLETGRSQPSRDMVLHLAELLQVPLRERNRLLLAAGYAPAFPERPLDDPALSAARHAVDLVLSGHEPNPAILVDRHWTLVAANRAAGRLLAGIPASQLQPPVNVLRLSLHPEGLAPRIQNLPEWRAHVLTRLRRQIDLTADPVLIELATTITNYAAPPGAIGDHASDPYGGVVVPLRLATEAGVLALFGTITVFGTPVDITLSELALESFFPADHATAEILRQMAKRDP
jgi:transcriptional regulator with XRE-family HTH domain